MDFNGLDLDERGFTPNNNKHLYLLLIQNP